MAFQCFLSSRYRLPLMFLVVGVVAFNGDIVFAQDEGGTEPSQDDDDVVSAPPDLYTLKTPDSPAFVSLGISPSEIQRPTTPSAFAAALVTAFEDEDGSVVVPNGLAIEFSPFWLRSHPDLSFEDYARTDFKSFWYQTATFSFATTESKSVLEGTDVADDIVATGTDFALGFRTTLIRPGLSGAQEACATKIHSRLNAVAKPLTGSIYEDAKKVVDAKWEQNERGIPFKPVSSEKPEMAKIATHKKPEKPTPPNNDFNDSNDSAEFNNEVQKYLTDLNRYFDDLDKYNARIKDEQKKAAQDYAKRLAEWEANRAAYAEYKRDISKEVEKIQDALSENNEIGSKVLNTEVASCMKVLNARGDGFSVDIAAAGVWNFENDDFNSGEFRRIFAWGTLMYGYRKFSAIALLRYLGEKGTIGGGMTNGADYGMKLMWAKHRWGASFEGVWRKFKGQKTLSRYAGGLEFRLKGETWANLVFGKDFGEGDNGGLIGLANLQFNFGEQQIAGDSSLLSQ